MSTLSFGFGGELLGVNPGFPRQGSDLLGCICARQSLCSRADKADWQSVWCSAALS